MSLRTAAFILLTPLSLAAGGMGMAAADKAKMIDLPSGARAYLQERLEDSLGDTGLTYRYRYVMPDLAQRVPSTSGPAGDFGAADVGADSDRAPLDIDLDAMGDEDMGDEDMGDDGLIAPEDFDFTPIITIPGTEEAADQAIDQTLAGDDSNMLPAAPTSVFKDPVHDDIIWLCENRALPDIQKDSAAGGRRPGQIVISLADRESRFGAYDPDVLQIFEAFTLPRDRDLCDWRPW